MLAQYGNIFFRVFNKFKLIQQLTNDTDSVYKARTINTLILQ